MGLQDQNQTLEITGHILFASQQDHTLPFRTPLHCEIIANAYRSSPSNDRQSQSCNMGHICAIGAILNLCELAL